MAAKDLILNIAVNLGRLSKFAEEGRTNRLDQFFLDTDRYVDQLKNAEKTPRIETTLSDFYKSYEHLKKNKADTDKDWTDEALTWANILTHRAKLA